MNIEERVELERRLLGISEGRGGEGRHGLREAEILETIDLSHNRSIERLLAMVEHDASRAPTRTASAVRMPILHPAHGERPAAREEREPAPNAAEQALAVEALIDWVCSRQPTPCD